jgi:anti-anti-sigma factor
VGKAGYLKVETACHGLVCVLAVTGELDLFTVADLAESAALKAPAGRFVLDLSWLSFIDGSGLRLPPSRGRVSMLLHIGHDHAAPVTLPL